MQHRQAKRGSQGRKQARAYPCNLRAGTEPADAAPPREPAAQPAAEPGLGLEQAVALPSLAVALPSLECSRSLQAIVGSEVPVCQLLCRRGQTMPTHQPGRLQQMTSLLTRSVPAAYLMGRKGSQSGSKPSEWHSLRR